MKPFKTHKLVERDEETFCPNDVDNAEYLEKLGLEPVYCNKICWSEDNPDFNNNEER